MTWIATASVHGNASNALCIPVLRVRSQISSVHLLQVFIRDRKDGTDRQSARLNWNERNYSRKFHQSNPSKTFAAHDDDSSKDIPDDRLANAMNACKP